MIRRLLLGTCCVAVLCLANSAGAIAAPGECGAGMQRENYGCVPNNGGRRGGGDYQRNYDGHYGGQYRQPGGYGGPRYGQQPGAYRPGECGPGYQKENYGCVPNYGRSEYEQPNYGGPRYGQQPGAYRPGECGPGYQKENYGCVPNVPRYWR